MNLGKALVGRFREAAALARAATSFDLDRSRPRSPTRLDPHLSTYEHAWIRRLSVVECRGIPLAVSSTLHRKASHGSTAFSQ